jgi:hypothetical protein
VGAALRGNAHAHGDLARSRSSPRGRIQGTCAGAATCCRFSGNPRNLSIAALPFSNVLQRDCTQLLPSRPPANSILIAILMLNGCRRLISCIFRRPHHYSLHALARSTALCQRARFSARSLSAIRGSKRLSPWRPARSASGLGQKPVANPAR